jgi:hypothetical protein
MQPMGTRSSNRGTRARWLGALGRGSLSILLPLLLLLEDLPCAALFGSCCPCSPEAVHSSRVLAPASCCGGSAGTKLTPTLVAEPQRSVGPPTILSTGSHGLSPVPGFPDLPQLSPAAIVLHGPPLLFLLLCTLRN